MAKRSGLFHWIKWRLIFPFLRLGKRILSGPPGAEESSRVRRVLRALLRPVYVWIILKVTPRGAVETRYFGIPVFVDSRDSTSYPYLIGDAHNRLEVLLCRRLLQPGDTALDIGANYGTFTVIMAQAVGPSGKVYAFEPAPGPFELLKRTIERNRFDWVEVVQCALSDREGTVPFAFHPELSAVSSLLEEKPNAETEGEVIMVPTKTLDAFFGESPPPIRLIKMDAEGAEFHILRGARRVLQSNSRLVLLSEVGRPHLRRFGVSPEEYLESIQELGFQIYHISYLEEGLVPVDIESVSRLLDRHSSVNIVAAHPGEPLPERL